MNWRVLPATISGTIEVPGDKSIAHRSLMIAALAKGTSSIENLPGGEDVRSTAACLRALGVDIRTAGATTFVEASDRLMPPDGPLDAGNSGTTTRLLAGILAGQPFSSILTGDESLRARPMARIAKPLELMGATVRSDDGRAPLSISGGRLKGVRYELPVASAQVKSCLLFAGLFAQGRTTVVEPVPTRDHTERMLAGAGVELHRDGLEIAIDGGQKPNPFVLQVPGDASAAAFFAAAAVLTRGQVIVRRCGVNPRRIGFFEALRHMGADVDITDERTEMGEPVATVTVSGHASQPIHITVEQVPSLVDELPLLALVATQAKGTSTISGAGELRYKECDRIRCVTRELSLLGANIEERDDGFVINGPARLHGAAVQSYGDHRMAMMLAVAGTLAAGTTIVGEAQAADVSFPAFESAFRATGANLDAA